MHFDYFSFFQFHPTVVTVESCQLSAEEIIITPTIPIRKTDRRLPKIRFQMPPDIDLLDSKSSCEIELQEGTKNITVKIKAACKRPPAKQGLQAIIPEISHRNSLFWSPRNVILPTIWVCMSYTMIYKIISTLPTTYTANTASDRKTAGALNNLQTHCLAKAFSIAAIITVAVNYYQNVAVN